MTWNTPPLALWLAVTTTIALVVVAIFVFIEPLFAPVPVIVAARENVSQASTPSIIAASRPMRLKQAIATEEYQKDLTARRTRLDPKGWRAQTWARTFHKWPEKPTAQPKPDATSDGATPAAAAG